MIKKGGREQHNTHTPSVVTNLKDVQLVILYRSSSVGHKNDNMDINITGNFSVM